ncbi:MFS transporter [Pontibacter silvestris]|uniref:MFS transporter n=1 Tax=Pontibacter silvestris TaxID=2305183 RepID=A0ABW4X5V3_9BACT|nr:MFS transporter [Pontibacter silvestris]MCC9138331.1 MFS transporter [Pontibacter silvestris]
MNQALPVFKSWVPEWLIRASIFLVLLPSMFILGIYAANITQAAGYYGIEPTDIQYSIVIYYAALAAFFPMEQRFFSYIATRNYFIIGTILLITCNAIFYFSKSPVVFISLRFLEGVLGSGVVGTCITLIFSRMQTERSRAMGYSVFYGILLSSSPLAMLVAAWVLEYFEFNVLYKALLFLQIPGALLLILIMNNVRIKRRIPLVQLEWVSYVFYSLLLCLVGYVLVYGQQLNWLEDSRIWGSLIAIVFLIAFFIIRQRTIKRPYLNLNIYKYRNFRIGIILMVIFYVCRSTTSVTSSFFANALGMDPIHISYVMLANLLGIVLSLAVTGRFILLKKSMRMIWLTGFGFLLIFHVWMYFLFSTQANATSFILPLFMQGLGSGVLMVSIVVFTVSSVPAPISGSASATGVSYRFLGFSMSMALISFFGLQQRSIHYQSFQQHVTQLNPVATERMAQYKQALLHTGAGQEQAAQLSSGLLSKAVALQTQLRFSMDYYAIISVVLAFVMLLIALVPHIRKTIINFRSKPIPF